MEIILAQIAVPGVIGCLVTPWGHILLTHQKTRPYSKTLGFWWFVGFLISVLLTHYFSLFLTASLVVEVITLGMSFLVGYLSQSYFWCYFTSKEVSLGRNYT